MSSPIGCSTRRASPLLSGTSFGRHGDGHLRISYASSLENLEQAVERIRGFVTAL